MYFLPTRRSLRRDREAYYEYGTRVWGCLLAWNDLAHGNQRLYHDLSADLVNSAIFTQNEYMMDFGSEIIVDLSVLG